MFVVDFFGLGGSILHQTSDLYSFKNLTEPFLNGPSYLRAFPGQTTHRCHVYFSAYTCYMCHTPTQQFKEPKLKRTESRCKQKLGGEAVR